MEKNSCYVGLELTSKSVKLIAGYVLDDLIYTLCTLEQECFGLENGLIVNDEEVVKSIKNIIAKVQKRLGIVVNEVSLIIPPFNMTCMSDNGTTLTISADDIIGNMDILNIITSMKKRKVSDDVSIINVIPNNYFIDSNQSFKDAPIGKLSKQLTIHASLYAVSAKVIHQFVYCVEKAGYKVEHRVVAPYAASLALSTNPQIPDKYILIDIGHSLTTVSHVHNRTTIINSRIVKFGGEDITENIKKEINALEIQNHLANPGNKVSDEINDIQDVAITYNEAELLKIKYGIDSNPNFPLFIRNKITFDDMSNAIIHSLQEPIAKIKDILKAFFPGEVVKLPVVLIGGTSEMNNIQSIIADELNLSVINYSVDVIGARNKGFLSVLGLIKYCDKQPKSNYKEQVTATVSRVEPKKNKKNDNEDIL